MVAHALFKRLAGTEERVSKDAFLKFWLPKNLASAPMVERVFHALKQEGEQVRRPTFSSRGGGEGSYGSGIARRAAWEAEGERG